MMFFLYMAILMCGFFVLYGLANLVAPLIEKLEQKIKERRDAECLSEETEPSTTIIRKTTW